MSSNRSSPKWATISQHGNHLGKPQTHRKHLRVLDKRELSSFIPEMTLSGRENRGRDCHIPKQNTPRGYTVGR